MFAGGVGAAGLLPHAVNAATAVAITSHFILVILASKPGRNQLIAGSGVVRLEQLEGRTVVILRGTEGLIGKHDAPDAGRPQHEVLQAVANKVAEHNNAGSIGGKDDAI